jgi:titin
LAEVIREDTNMLGNGLFRIAMAVSAVFVLNSCLAGEDVPGDDPIDNPDLGSLVENIALPPPTLLSATAVTPTAETITWSAVSDPSLKYYIVDRGNTPTTLTTLTSVQPTKTTFTQTSLTPNTQYCWAVRDVNTLNQVSGRSNVLCATTPATSTTPAPTGLTATAVSDTRISLSWNPVAGATVYHPFIRVAGSGGAFSPLPTVTAPTTTLLAANLQPATTYEFVVTAVTVNGESAQSNIATATTFGAGIEA